MHTKDHFIVKGTKNSQKNGFKPVAGIGLKPITQTHCL